MIIGSQYSGKTTLINNICDFTFPIHQISNSETTISLQNRHENPSSFSNITCKGVRVIQYTDQQNGDSITNYQLNCDSLTKNQHSEINKVFTILFHILISNVILINILLQDLTNISTIKQIFKIITELQINHQKINVMFIIRDQNQQVDQQVVIQYFQSQFCQIFTKSTTFHSMQCLFLPHFFHHQAQFLIKSKQIKQYLANLKQQKSSFQFSTNNKIQHLQKLLMKDDKLIQTIKNNTYQNLINSYIFYSMKKQINKVVFEILHSNLNKNKKEISNFIKDNCNFQNFVANTKQIIKNLSQQKQINIILCHQLSNQIFQEHENMFVKFYNSYILTEYENTIFFEIKSKYSEMINNKKSRYSLCPKKVDEMKRQFVSGYKTNVSGHHQGNTFISIFLQKLTNEFENTFEIVISHCYNKFQILLEQEICFCLKKMIFQESNHPHPIQFILKPFNKQLIIKKIKMFCLAYGYLSHHVNYDQLCNSIIYTTAHLYFDYFILIKSNQFSKSNISSEVYAAIIIKLQKQILGFYFSLIDYFKEISKIKNITLGEKNIKQKIESEKCMLKIKEKHRNTIHQHSFHNISFKIFLFIATFLYFCESQIILFIKFMNFKKKNISFLVIIWNVLTIVLLMIGIISFIRRNYQGISKK